MAFIVPTDNLKVGESFENSKWYIQMVYLLKNQCKNVILRP